MNQAGLIVRAYQSGLLYAQYFVWYFLLLIYGLCLKFGGLEHFDEWEYYWRFVGIMTTFSLAYIGYCQLFQFLFPTGVVATKHVGAIILVLGYQSVGLSGQVFFGNFNPVYTSYVGFAQMFQIEEDPYNTTLVMVI